MRPSTTMSKRSTKAVVTASSFLLCIGVCKVFATGSFRGKPSKSHDGSRRQSETEWRKVQQLRQLQKTSGMINGTTASTKSKKKKKKKNLKGKEDKDEEEEEEEKKQNCEKINKTKKKKRKRCRRGNRYEDEPAVNTTAPSVNSTAPSTNTTEPSTNTTKPSTNTTKPSTNTTKPSTNTTVDVSSNNTFNTPDFEEFIIGGTSADPYEYPFFAERAYSNTPSGCGGSLIAKNWVLTAAQCLDNRLREDRDSPQWRVGSYCVNGTIENNCGVDFTLAESLEVLLHPNWDAHRFAYDFGLARLDRVVDATPVSIDDGRAFNNLEEGAYVRSIGMGWVNDEGESADILQKVNNLFLPPDKCGLPTRESIMCTNGKDFGNCRGDSGSPNLVFDGTTPTTWRQVGVTSFGARGSCENHTRPDGLARVSAAYPWIVEKVCGNYMGETPEFCPAVEDPVKATSPPTRSPTRQPTTNLPTEAPTRSPTHGPTLDPTHLPTLNPTSVPTADPTTYPSPVPSRFPSREPATRPPTRAPTADPTTVPTLNPTIEPTADPVTPQSANDPCDDGFSRFACCKEFQFFHFNDDEQILCAKIESDKDRERYCMPESSDAKRQCPQSCQDPRCTDGG